MTAPLQSQAGAKNKKLFRSAWWVARRRHGMPAKSMAVAADEDFLGWLVNTAFPVLLQAAPKLLPLLL